MIRFGEALRTFMKVVGTCGATTAYKCANKFSLSCEHRGQSNTLSTHRRTYQAEGDISPSVPAFQIHK